MRTAAVSPLTAAPPPRAVHVLLLLLHAVCPLLFFTDLTRNPYFTQISLLHAGLCVSLLLVAVAALGRGGISLTTTPLDVPLLAFLVVAAASWGASWLAHPPFRPSVWSEGKRVTHFLALNGVAAYWLAAQASDPRWRARARRVVLAVGVVAAAYGVMQYMGRDPIWPTALNPFSVGRPVSTFGNPNFLSAYLLMLLPLALQELAVVEGGAARALSAAVFITLGAGIISTMTRSSWIGAAVAVGVFLAGARGVFAGRRRWSLFALTVTLALVLFWPGSPLADHKVKPIQRMTELVRGIAREKAYGSWHQRLMIWSCSYDMIRERPWLGKGWGCFELFYPFYQGHYLSDAVFKNFRTHANNAHNVVLEIWSQTGTLGLGVFLWVFAFLAFLARRRIPALPEEDRPEAWALFAGAAGMLADNFFGNVSLFFAVPAFLFWWTMGTLGAVLAPGAACRIDARRPFVRGAAFLVIVVALAGVRAAYRQWRAEVFYFEGFKKAKSGDVKGAVAATEKSHAYRRFEVNNNYEMGNAYARQAKWAVEQRLENESKDLAAKTLWAYDEALDANAGYDEIYFNRGTVLYNMGRLEEAARNYRTALLINPLGVESYRALGNITLNGGKPRPESVDLFERATFYYPRDKDFWNNLGFAYTKLDRPRDALEAYAHALRLDFEFVTAARNLQVALAALKQADHPLLKIPSLSQALQSAARGNRWPEARKAAQSLVDLAPENLKARLLLGNVVFQQKDYAASEENFRQVLAFEPSHWEARLNLGKTFAARGDRAAAVEEFRRLRLQDPANQEVPGLLRSLGENPDLPALPSAPAE